MTRLSKGTGTLGLGATLGVVALTMALLPARSSDGAAAGGAPPAVIVTMSENRFVPGAMRVRAGTTVVWRNTSDLVHTVTASGFDFGNIVPGGSYRRTFTTPGTYSYRCIPHEQAGMVGTVVVSR